jgi:hypothetical protein
MRAEKNYRINIVGIKFHDSFLAGWQAHDLCAKISLRFQGWLEVVKGGAVPTLECKL